VGVQREARRRVGRDADPAVTHHLAQELGEQIEQAGELAAHAERAHLGGDHGFEQRLIQVGGDAVTDLRALVTQMDEELVGRRGRADGPAQRTQQIAHPALEHVVTGAGALGPESVALIVGTAQDHRHVLGRRLGLEQTTQLHARDARHPQVGDHRRGRIRQGGHRTLGRARGGHDVIALHAQALREHLPPRRVGVDENQTSRRIHA